MWLLGRAGREIEIRVSSKMQRLFQQLRNTHAFSRERLWRWLLSDQY